MALPKISIEEIVPKNITANVIEKDPVDGNVSEKEIEVIARIAAYCKPQSIFECGTFDGRTTINMALNAPPDARVYTLDLPAAQINSTKYKLASAGQWSDATYIQKSESGARYKGKQNAGKISQLYGDSATFDYAPYRENIDLIFVDGSHARDYTKNDTEAALSMLKPGGVILWHDYGSVWPDVTAVLDEYAQQDPRFENLKHITGTTLAILFLPIK